MTDGPRFTVCEMRPRDWNLLASTLPREEECTGLEQDLRWFAWGNGWHTRDGRTYGENGRKYHRRIWKGLADGPCQVGPFRIERAGRWGIVFVLDVAYAAQRTSPPTYIVNSSTQEGTGSWLTANIVAHTGWAWITEPMSSKAL